MQLKFEIQNLKFESYPKIQISEVFKNLVLVLAHNTHTTVHLQLGHDHKHVHQLQQQLVTHNHHYPRRATAQKSGRCQYPLPVVGSG